MLNGRFPPAMRFVVFEPNATKRPSPLMAEMPLASFPSSPALFTLTRVVTPGGCASAATGPRRPTTTNTARSDPATLWAAERVVSLSICALICRSFDSIGERPALFGAAAAYAMAGGAVMVERRDWAHERIRSQAFVYIFNLSVSNRE